MGYLRAKNFQGPIPHAALSIEHAEAVMKVGKFGMSLQQALVPLNCLILMPLFREHFKSKLVEIGRSRVFVTTHLHLMHTFFATQHAQQIKQSRVFGIPAPSANRFLKRQLRSEE